MRFSPACYMDPGLGLSVDGKHARGAPECTVGNLEWHAMTPQEFSGGVRWVPSLRASGCSVRIEARRILKFSNAAGDADKSKIARVQEFRASTAQSI